MTSTLMIKEGHLVGQVIVGPSLPSVSDVMAEDLFQQFSTIYQLLIFVLKLLIPIKLKIVWHISKLINNVVSKLF
jgi:hypothetical protein